MSGHDGIKTVLDTLVSGADWLAKRGVPEARLNMEHLLAHVLGLKRLDLYLQFDRPLGEVELGPLRDLLRKRGQRVPLQHLLGTVEFCGRVFRCDGRALVPRPETEELVAIMVAAGPPRADARVLDMGCGSGVLGLSLAIAWAEAEVEVVMADVSAASLDLARENADQLGLEAGRLHFVETDLWAGLKGWAFEVVVANLPYLDAADMAGVNGEVAHDPDRALDGGEDGLAVIRRFIEGTAGCPGLGGFITDSTRLGLEVGASQGAEVAAILERAGCGPARIARDLNGHDRFVVRA